MRVGFLVVLFSIVVPCTFDGHTTPPLSPSSYLISFSSTYIDHFLYNLARIVKPKSVILVILKFKLYNLRSNLMPIDDRLVNGKELFAMYGIQESLYMQETV